MNLAFPIVDYRRAGLLPPAAPVSEEKEAGQILRRLPANVRAAVMTMLHSLAEPYTPYEEKEK